MQRRGSKGRAVFVGSAVLFCDIVTRGRTSHPIATRRRNARFRNGAIIPFQEIAK
jgi:hypothetical protein